MIAVWLVVAALSGPAAAAGDGAAELVSEIELTLDGQRVVVESGKRATATVGGREVEVTATVRPTRRFTYRDVSFRIPTGYAYRVDDADPAVTHYEFDGNDTSVILMVFPAGVPVQAMAEVMLAAAQQHIGAKPDPGQEATLKTATGRLTGRRADLRMGGVVQRQFVYPVKTPAVSAVLYVQDSLADDGDASAEYAGLVRLFAASLRVGEKEAGAATQPAGE